MKKMTLRALRTNEGLTQKEVAERLGKSNKTISNWEKGLTFPEPKDIDLLCELYHVSYDNINFLHENSL